MKTAADRKRWSELVSVGIAAVGGAFLLFEVLRSKLPDHLRAAIDQSGELAAWAVAAAIGLSVLFTGVGVMLVSAIRLYTALRRADAAEVRAMAKDHLGSTMMVLAGFVLSVGALYTLSLILA